MAAVVAFLSQKGGVGKSTLARTLAVVATNVGLKVTVADLDPQQRTLMRWAASREQNSVEPVVAVAGFETPQEAIDAARDRDLVVLDLPGCLSDDIATFWRQVHLMVQPTSPSIDDLHPALLVLQVLQGVQIPKERVALALCRALGDKEAEATREYLAQQGHTVLRGVIQERLAYRNALNLGRTLCETKQPALNSVARLMMLDLLDRALSTATADERPSCAVDATEREATPAILASVPAPLGSPPAARRHER